MSMDKDLKIVKRFRQFDRDLAAIWDKAHLNDILDQYFIQSGYEEVRTRDAAIEEWDEITDELENALTKDAKKGIFLINKFFKTTPYNDLAFLKANEVLTGEQASPSKSIDLNEALRYWIERSRFLVVDHRDRPDDSDPVLSVYANDERIALVPRDKHMEAKKWDYLQKPLAVQLSQLLAHFERTIKIWGQPRKPPLKKPTRKKPTLRTLALIQAYLEEAGQLTAFNKKDAEILAKKKGYKDSPDSAERLWNYFNRYARTKNRQAERCEWKRPGDMIKSFDYLLAHFSDNDKVQKIIERDRAYAIQKFDDK